MHHRFKMSAGVGALLAAMVIGGAARAQTAEAANTDNGVHAAPSAPVAEAPLAAVGARKPARAAEASVKTHAPALAPAPAPAPVIKEAANTAPQAAASGRLTLELVGPASGAPAGPAPAVQSAPAPAPEPPPVALAAADAPAADSAPAEASAPPPVLAEAAPPAPAAGPAPLLARAEPPASAPAVVAASDPAQDASEEAAVYGRPVQQFAAADPDPEHALGDRDPGDNGDSDLRDDAQAPPQAAPPQGVRQHVAFPLRSAEAAAAFDRYMHAAAAIDADFKSGEGVASALDSASAYDPGQLEEGMIAYGAIAALQSPRFVYAVMDAAADERSRQGLIDALVADPSIAARLPGAADAAGLAGGDHRVGLAGDGAAGEALKQAAYDVQHQSWSTLKAGDGRLARAKAGSSGRIAARDGDVARLLTQVSTTPQLQGGGSSFTQVTDRSIALAALSILDGTEDPARVDSVIREPASAECLKLAKLNLYQCLSVAGPEYEDVYCLGQHAVLDTGKCVASAASPTAALRLASASRMSRIPGGR